MATIDLVNILVIRTPAIPTHHFATSSRQTLVYRYNDLKVRRDQPRFQTDAESHTSSTSYFTIYLTRHSNRDSSTQREEAKLFIMDSKLC